MSLIDNDEDGLAVYRLALATQTPENSVSSQEKRTELRTRFLNLLEYLKTNQTITPIELDFHRAPSLTAAHCLSIDSNFSQIIVQDLQTHIGRMPTASIIYDKIKPMTTATATIEEQTIAAVDKEKTPFVYIDSCLTQSTDEAEEQYDGCSCSTNDTCVHCPCANRFGRNYNSQHCLTDNQTGPVFECNSECCCSFDTCQNRVSQKEDQSTNVQIIFTSNKGCGVILQQAILHPGTYVGEYVGEVLSESEAHHRISSTAHSEHNYLLLYNEHHSQTIVKTFIDARHYGNWTRFINHSCEPNLHIVPIRVDTPTPPRLAFFSRRAIQANEELSYSYGTTINAESSKPCHCSSLTCTGFMPYQQNDC